MASSTFPTELIGYSQVVGGLEDLMDGWSTKAEWVVGTDAEYAIFVHEGTSRMEGRPFLTDAVDEVVRSQGDRIAKKASSGDEVVAMIALELEGETKDKITEYNAVDTGAMRSGVAAIQL